MDAESLNSCRGRQCGRGCGEKEERKYGQVEVYIEAVSVLASAMR